MRDIVQGKQNVLANLASPYGLAMISYLVFLAAWVFPGPLYTAIVHEPDLLWCDPLTFLYFTASVAAFLAGVRTIDSLLGSARSELASAPRVGNSLVYLLTPMLLAMVLCGMYLATVGSRIDFIGFISAEQGNLIKLVQSNGILDTKWGYALPFLIGSVWWASYRSAQMKLLGADRAVFELCRASAVGMGVLAFIATVDRGNQLDFLSGLGVVVLFTASRRSNVSGKAMALRVLVGVAVVIIVFAGLAFTRGEHSQTLMLRSLVGYSFASYNRLAALLSGRLTYVYHGRLVYLAPYLNGRHKLDSILPIAEYMGWPTFTEIWKSEFFSIGASGLNPLFIWSGAFGYLYSDLGWGALAYLYCAGLLVGYTWRRFRAGGSVSLVLYPYMAFWILFWVSAANLLDYMLVSLVEVAIGLTIWERLCLRSARHQTVRYDAIGMARSCCECPAEVMRAPALLSTVFGTTAASEDPSA